MLEKASVTRMIKGFKVVEEGLTITHLHFVDDSNHMYRFTEINLCAEMCIEVF